MDLLWDIRMPFTKHSSLSTALAVDGQSCSSHQLQAWVFPENRGAPLGSLRLPFRKLWSLSQKVVFLGMSVGDMGYDGDRSMISDENHKRC